MEEDQEDLSASHVPGSIIQRLTEFTLEQTWIKITAEDKTAWGEETYQFLKQLKEWKLKQLPKSQLYELVLERGVERVIEHISAIELKIGPPQNSGTSVHFHFVGKQVHIYPSAESSRNEEGEVSDTKKVDSAKGASHDPTMGGTSKKVKECPCISVYFICSVLGDIISSRRRIQPLYTTIYLNNIKSALEKLLKNNRHLEIVRFASNVLNPDEFEHFVNSLINSTANKIEFDPANVVVGMGKMSVIKRWHDFLGVCASVQQLILYPDQAILRPKVPVLKLTPAQLTNPDNFMRYLSNVNRCITSLRVEGFDSGSLANLFKQKGVRELLCGHPAIRDLTLFNITLGDSYGEQLIDLIPGLICPNIQGLTIEGCEMRNFHLQKLLGGLVSQNVTLARFSLANNPAVLNKAEDSIWEGLSRLQLKNLNLSNTFNPKDTYNTSKKAFHLITQGAIGVLDISHNGRVSIQKLPALIQHLFNATHFQALHMDGDQDFNFLDNVVFDAFKNISHHPANNLWNVNTLSFCGYNVKATEGQRLAEMLRNSKLTSLTTFRISTGYPGNCTNYLPQNLTGFPPLMDNCFLYGNDIENIPCGLVYGSLFMEAPTNLFSPVTDNRLEGYVAFVNISNFPWFTVNFDCNKPCLEVVGRKTNNITISVRPSFFEFNWLQETVNWWGRPAFNFEQFHNESAWYWMELKEFPYICRYRNPTGHNVQSNFSYMGSITSFNKTVLYADDCPAQISNNMIAQNAISLVKDLSILRGICDGLFQNALCSEVMFVLGSSAPFLIDSFYDVGSSYDFNSVTLFIVIPIILRLVLTFSLFEANASLPRRAMALLALPIYFYRAYQEGLWSITIGILTGSIFQQAAYTAINDTKWLINEKSSRKVTQAEYLINIVTIPIMCAHECVTPRKNITDGIIRCGLFATALLHRYRGPTKSEKETNNAETKIPDKKQRSCPLPCAIL